ncbi:hypothetical protein [Curtobacterium sp. MCSS17_016]|uniref:hypothetical protein n=1 Tax=Curtobacterium sp. MCSS17_016 TaxID=2175644 RepID=UPI000DA6F7BD|nr:hypothetical protein [Curtobacterium sp. MCSS17_016]WIE81487.1 hypothetical protein DEJ19_019820 [Curtobacterium sp. MCSS17_016]
MGHTTVNIDFTAAEADRILAAGDRSDVRYFGPNGMWQPNDLVTAAVARWRDSDDAYGDENSGPATTLPLTTPRTINGALPHGSQTFILPVCADADVIRTTAKVKVTGTPTEMAALRARHSDGHPPSNVAAVRTALEQFGATVEQVKVASVSAPRKPVAKATDGKLVTTYQVVEPRQWGEPRVVASGATMAEARQAGIDLMVANPAIGELTVEAVVVRQAETGLSKALATISRPETNTHAIIEVTTAVPKPGAKPASYIVGFDVHH